MEAAVRPCRLLRLVLFIYHRCVQILWGCLGYRRGRGTDVKTGWMPKVSRKGNRDETERQAGRQTDRQTKHDMIEHLRLHLQVLLRPCIQAYKPPTPESIPTYTLHAWMAKKTTSWATMGTMADPSLTSFSNTTAVQQRLTRGTTPGSIFPSIGAAGF